MNRMNLLFRFQMLLLCITVSATCYGGTRAKHAMVVSGHRLASSAGVEILKKGGNAVDAAVAVGFALAVVFPEAGNIGGGGFALIRMKDGTATVVDFREVAPKGATRTMYMDENGKAIRSSVDGHLSAGVPGTVAGFETMLKSGGKLSLRETVEPAIRLAEEGFLVDRHLEENLADYKKQLSAYPSTMAIFSKDGEMLTEGDLLVQPDLAATLRRIQEQGKDGFYKGITAKLIAEEMKRNGGLITEEDLAQYETVVRKPLSGEYRGYQILTMPPPSGGGIALLEMLSIMEQFSFEPKDYHSSRSVHLMSEAMKRAYADRHEFSADPKFVSVPVNSLTSKKYLRQIKAEIDTLRATPSSRVKPGTIEMIENDNTTHYVVADEEGNVVSVTYTLNDLFGSKVVVEGAGFFLNDEMDDFAMKPGVPNIYGLIGSEKNSITPGKRPVSSMTPTIVVKDGVPVFALGARGGPRIITAVFQTLINAIDFRMDIERAVNEPRFHHQLYPDTLLYESYGLPEDVLNNLKQRGHNLKQVKTKLGSIEALYRDPETGWLYSGEDRREGGASAGY